MSIYDPTCGSGGMLIQACRLRAVRAAADPRNLVPGRAGVNIGTTWADLQDEHAPARHSTAADIREERHAGRRRQAHGAGRRAAPASTGCSPTRPSRRTIPPQRHASIPARFPGVDAGEGREGRPDVRAAHGGGHSRPTGRWRPIMPHGVLFRGGGEREARQPLHRATAWLEAVIGLPGGLFFGTGIPACVLVLNEKAGTGRAPHARASSSTPTASTGKARPRFSPPDIASSSTWRTPTCPATPPCVPVAEIAARISTATSAATWTTPPPPEPHDVAHLHGGVPTAEIEALARFWRNYPRLRDRLFQPRAKDKAYADFTLAAADRRALADLVKSDNSVATSHAACLATLQLGGPSTCRTSRPSHPPAREEGNASTTPPALRQHRRSLRRRRNSPSSPTTRSAVRLPATSSIQTRVQIHRVQRFGQG